MCPSSLPGMIQSLQMPVVTLISKIAQSVNSSNFNFSEISERMQLAIEGTVQAAEQVRQLLSGIAFVWLCLFVSFHRHLLALFSR